MHPPALLGRPSFHFTAAWVRQSARQARTRNGTGGGFEPYAPMRFKGEGAQVIQFWAALCHHVGQVRVTNMHRRALHWSMR